MFGFGICGTQKQSSARALACKPTPPGRRNAAGPFPARHQTQGGRTEQNSRTLTGSCPSQDFPASGVRLASFPDLFVVRMPQKLSLHKTA